MEVAINRYILTESLRSQYLSVGFRKTKDTAQQNLDYLNKKDKEYSQQG